MADGRGAWRPTRRSDVADLALTACLGAGAAISLYIGGDEALVGSLADYHRPTGIALVTFVIAPLVVRRRYPLAVLATMSAAYVPFILLEIPELTAGPVAYFIALYTAGAYGGPRRDWVRGLAVLTVVVLLVEVVLTSAEAYEGRVSLWVVNLFGVAQNAFYLAAAWFLGDLVRTRREREATLLGQADALRSAQAERARRAVLDERVRIARELHDVVAHHVSVMGVQAGAARRVLDTRPVAVPELLSSIEASSREAVAELQRMLGLLRGASDRDRDRDQGLDGADDRRTDGGERADPQPTIAQLDSLVGHMSEAGLDVSATLEGDAAGLPPAVDLSAYRIVQEALTNTLKHAGPGTAATVTVVRRSRSLEIAVRDEGRPVAGNGRSPGRPASPIGATAGDGEQLGLVGMRERVALLGGELKTGRAEGGGFEVRAWLPLRDRSDRSDRP